MLTRNGRQLRKTLKALTDPQPEFVSLVFGGANKTPFRAMRADGATVVETEMSEDMALKAETHAIAKVEFAGDKFGDEDAVKAWLLDGGYDPDLPVTKTAEGFLVDGGEIEADSVISIIDLADTAGVKIHAIALKTDDVLELTEKADSDAAVHPGASPEMRQRYCEAVSCCDTCYGAGNTLAEVIANNWEGVPPGLLDLTMALYDAVRNCLREANYPGASAAIGEYVTMLNALTKLFPPKEEATFKAFVDAIAPEIEMSNEATPAKTDEAVESVKTDATVEAVAAETGETTEATTVETAEVAKTDETTAESEQVVGGVTTDETVAAADETVDAAKTDETNSDDAAVETAKSDDPLAALTAAVGELANSVKAMQGNLSSEIEQVVQRVAAIEDVRQTRKGADVDETNTAGLASSTDSDRIASMRTRSVLGMRRSESN